MRSLAAALLFASALAACSSTASDGAPAVDDGARFARFKALEGDWIAMGTTEAPEGAKVSYRVTSGGSAVVEKVFEGADHEMVTMYHLDAGRLVLTHYCAIGNQPRMSAHAGEDDGTVRFSLTSLGNGDVSKDMHMHEAAFTFVAGDHLQTAWTLWKDGRPGETVGFDLRRAR